MKEQPIWRQPAFLLLLAITLLLVSCESRPTPTTVVPPSSEELIFYDWPDDVDPQVLEAFTAETGIRVRYEVYGSVDDAVQDLRNGEHYDVVILTNEWVAKMVAEGRLAEIDYANVPNFRYISANFRDLAYDPQNRHAIPWNWGTTTMAYRSDLITTTLTSWADLWTADYQGPIAATPAMRDVIGVVLKGLGYSCNSEDPAELAAAREILLQLRPRMILLTADEATTAPYLINGRAPVAIVQPRDVLEAQAESASIVHLYPREGSVLWGDNFVIPTQSHDKAGAERLINFLLRPENAAQLVSYNLYPTPNDGAIEYIAPELANNQVIFPPQERLSNAEVLLPVSPEANEIYMEIWEAFMAADN
jgi:spermidine/putrescine transport system substrate-binding protein